MEGLSDPVVVGTVAGAHGVRGTIRVRSEGHHLREDISPSIGGVRYRILKARETPKGFLLDLEGITSRQDAVLMQGRELVLDRAELDEPEEGEFYVADLIGLSAVDESGTELGTVTETIPSPAHETLVVRAGESEVFVPFTLEHVPEVLIEAGRIVVRVPKE